MLGWAPSCCSPSVGFNVLGIHQTRLDMNYFLTIPIQGHHCDPAIRALQISAGMITCFIPHSTQSSTNMTVLGFVLILEHSFWSSKRHPRFTSITMAFRIYRSSFSTAVQAAITDAFPEVITQNDTSDRTRIDGIISRLLDVIMANRLR